MALLRKCIYAKLLYFEGFTGVVWFQVVFVLSNSLVSSLEQIAEYQDCSWASLPGEFNDICTVPLPFLVSLQFRSVQCGDRALSSASSKHLFLCCNEHNVSIFFIFPFCHSILCPPSAPSRKCILVFSVEFLFAFSWSSALQQSVEC